MEKDLDDCEFWLPPQFLTDDDLLMDFKTPKDGNKLFGGDFTYGFNPFGPHSDLSSPVGSVVGSTETESDEDNDYITGLTRKMANYTMQNTKGLSLSGSPQSTLCGCKNGSSRGSPNGPSQVSSPTGMTRPEVNMDLLYAAAGEVARIRMMEDYNNKGGPGIWAAPPRKTTSPVPVGPKKHNPNLGSFSTNQQQQLSYQQLQVAQFQRLKQQQQMMMKQGVLGNGKGGFRQFPLNQNHQQMARNGGTLNLPNSAWPTLQQSQQQPNPGSGTRAVFLGNTGPKRECAGTGVFLPRRVGTQPENRKKPGCPVILPDRVVQALNLNLEAMDAASARPQSQVRTSCHNGDVGFTPATDGGLKYRNNMAVAVQQRRNQRSPPVAAMPQELQLPQEWTY
ncbi:uncharacterized protein LOC132630589 [Lycium barbarum]|uniref:uncharacterized protein LOC132630589 n=1 Tax=Lycium barbarum TaxID=112863 RepID=UPI00293E9ABC|nr:uncharacterized protein LOC132630589 [Lycium barbarum]